MYSRPWHWKKGPVAARQELAQPRARCLTSDPATVCFLFDTAILWNPNPYGPEV